MTETESPIISRAASPTAERLFTERHRLLKARGLRMDCRAKCASGRVFHWASVMEESGREMASSGGWYETEDEAVEHAMAVLGFEALPSK